MDLKKILYFLPEVKHPIEKKLSFNQKLKWTIIVLVAFFVLANIPLFGLTNNALQRFEYLALILGTEFGSIISLGIGPIVMSSIILQLLVGSGILKIDVSTSEGKKYFQGIQKLGVIVFIILEATIYVVMGGLQAVSGLAWLVIFQLVLGGLAVMLMDEVSTKWGLGSGVSLFIVAGVAWRLVAGLIQFLGTSGENCLSDFTGTACSGKILVIVQSVINGDTTEMLVAIAAIIATVLIFSAVVWAQSLKVEIPLTYERMRGYGIKWPLAFFYASNIPVILAAALLANIQLLGTLLQNYAGHPTFMGNFQSGQAVSGLVFWLSHSNLVESLLRSSFSSRLLVQALTHTLFFAAISALFAVLWVKTAGMDESSQAKKIIASGLQIPGFRKDQRVLESILKRYILPLTIMGGIAVGLLSAFADTLGALTSGTALLLAVMIMYQLYQNIAQQHAVDMHPALRKFVT
jgi:preprotein translocase subunit SecY